MMFRSALKRIAIFTVVLASSFISFAFLFFVIVYSPRETISYSAVLFWILLFLFSIWWAQKSKYAWIIMSVILGIIFFLALSSKISKWVEDNIIAQNKFIRALIERER